MIITNEMMFNKDTLNIFTDASIRKMPDGEVIGSAGYNVINGYDVISSSICGQEIIRNTTSNNSEIHAVRLGIQQAIKYKNHGFRNINLISDSKICIYGLREWIFNWVRDSVNSDYLIGSTRQKVANQDVILDIVYKILYFNLRINLFHQNGHVNTNSEKDLLSAKATFRASNHIDEDVDIELIKNISIANNAIDSFTRNIVKSIIIPERVLETRPLIEYSYVPFDVDKYARLLNLK